MKYRGEELHMKTSILEYLEESARKYPDKTAFADEHTSLTYRGLSDLSMRIGSVLAQKTGPRRPVPVLTEKMYLPWAHLWALSGQAVFMSAWMQTSRRTSEPDSGHP